jgi:multiple antibiotic resistance protein
MSESTAMLQKEKKILGLVIGLIAAAGATAVHGVEIDPVASQEIPAAQAFTLLFLMLGPFKIVGPFAQVTKGADAALVRRISLMATLFASAAVLIAAFLGQSILESYGVPVPVLALSGGVILFLVALLGILGQFAPPASHVESDEALAPPSALKVALSPLAFPAIVTPYGIAALIVMLAISPTQASRVVIGAIVLAIMCLNLLVMLLTRHILPFMGIVLPILGAILGVVQVALGLQIINNSLRTMGIL